MISYAQAVILGLLQGVAELFPISSLGNSVILPQLLGWNIHQNDAYFLTFLVATHLATAIVLFIFFFDDWMRIFRGIGRSLRDRSIEDTDAKLGWLIVVGSIPAGILGLLLEHPLRSLFASATSASVFLILNGGMLYAAEKLRRRSVSESDPNADVSDLAADKRVAKLTWRQSIYIGTAQAIALIPGFSRSGATISGGLLVGLRHDDAARFGFLLATPLIAAAAILKLPELLGHEGDGVRGQALVGALAAGVAAWFAIRFLMKYLHTNSLLPFAWYCLVGGAASYVYLQFIQ